MSWCFTVWVINFSATLASTLIDSSTLRAPNLLSGVGLFFSTKRICKSRRKKFETPLIAFAGSSSKKLFRLMTASNSGPTIEDVKCRTI